MAIDQTGGRKLAATRLYLWIDVPGETVYLLTLGDKSTQHDDIQDCKRFARRLQADRESERGGGEGDGRELSEDDLSETEGD